MTPPNSNCCDPTEISDNGIFYAELFGSVSRKTGNLILFTKLRKCGYASSCSQFLHIKQINAYCCVKKIIMIQTSYILRHRLYSFAVFAEVGRVSRSPNYIIRHIYNHNNEHDNSLWENFNLEEDEKKLLMRYTVLKIYQFIFFKYLL